MKSYKLENLASLYVKNTNTGMSHSALYDVWSMMHVCQEIGIEFTNENMIPISKTCFH